MKKHTLGFTVVELMITVIIVGTLGAVAIPEYQEYAQRVAAARAEMASCEKDTANRPAHCPAKKQIEQPVKPSIL